MEIVRLDINYDGTLKGQSASSRFSFATSVSATKEYVINVSVTAGFAATVTINKIVVEAIKPNNELLSNFDTPVVNKIIATFRPDIGQNKINTESVLLLFIDYTSSGGNGPIPDATTYDFIIIGGGPTGSAIARRLSDVQDVNGNYLYNVLLLEAGKNYLSDANITVPGNTFGLQNNKYMYLLVNTDTNIAAVSGGVLMPFGRCLGGGSSVNYMQAVRPSPALQDAWAAYGGTSWNHANMLTYFKKFENTSALTTVSPNPAIRGTSGPVILRDFATAIPGSLMTIMKNGVVNTANTAKYNNTAVPIVTDQNGDYEVFVTDTQQYFQQNVPGGFIRSHVGTSYLTPAVVNASGVGQNGRKLTVKCESPVIKILTDNNNKAVGVLYLDQTTNTVVPLNLNSAALSGGLSSQVVLSAGIHDAPILQRSGVGDQALLTSLSIPVKYHNPWVGENLQNHSGFACYLQCSDAAKAGALFSDLSNWGIAPILFMVTRMTQSGQTLRRWQIMITPAVFTPPAIVPLGISLANAVAVIAWNVVPYSRGNVKIVDADITNEPLVTNNYSSDAGGIDRAEILELLRLMPDLAVKLTAADGVATWDMLYPDNSTYDFQMSGPSTYVLDADGFRISQASSDTKLINWWKANNSMGAHWAGSCRMAANGNLDSTDATGRGVVNGNLNVYGLTGVKVADMQVCPVIPNANLTAMCYAMGEKTADVILAGN